MAGATARIKIDLDRTVGTIDRKIFGGFIEHLGRCIYGGIVDEGSPLSDERGFRTDVLDALRPLRMPVLRWPGGNFVSGYIWTDGIGPRDKRPRRLELAWHDVESNRFGTDEYIAYCRELGTEPYICVNMGTGTMEEARSWVEYCNGTEDTYWANLRRENGHEEPYNVQYWGLGNEMYGNWQIGALSAEDYVKKAIEFAKVMLWTDPSIELVSCGYTGSAAWDRTVLEGLAKFIRYHAIHIYTGSDHVAENLAQPLLAERELENCRTEIARVRMQQGIEHSIAVAYDEWNVWYRARQPERLEEHYNLSDALAVATYLNVFVRQADVMGMANLAQMVNVLAPIFTSPDSLFLQTTYHPLALLAEHTQQVALDAWVDAPESRREPGMLPEGKPSRAAKLGEYSLLDVAASRDDARQALALSLVNRSESERLETTIELTAGSLASSARVFTITGDDPHSVNDFDAPDRVGVAESRCELSGDRLVMILPPLSHTVVTVTTGA